MLFKNLYRIDAPPQPSQGGEKWRTADFPPLARLEGGLRGEASNWYPHLIFNLHQTCPYFF
jgi:hypothetical protein